MEQLLRVFLLHTSTYVDVVPYRIDAIIISQKMLRCQVCDHKFNSWANGKSTSPYEEHIFAQCTHESVGSNNKDSNSSPSTSPIANSVPRFNTIFAWDRTIGSIAYRFEHEHFSQEVIRWRQQSIITHWQDALTVCDMPLTMERETLVWNIFMT